MERRICLLANPFEMKKYYLQPEWDIVPTDKGIRLFSIDQAIEPINLKGDYWLTFFDELRSGIAKKTLVEKYGMNSVINKLFSSGAIRSEMVKPNISCRRNISALEKQIVGPGNIVCQIIKCPIESNNPFARNFYIYYAGGFGPRFIKYQSSLSGGWGADTNSELARIKSIAEATERYALADYDEKEITHAVWDEVCTRAIDPVALGTDSLRLKGAGEIEWCEIQGLNNGQELVAPIDFIYHPVDYFRFKRLPVAQLNISGIAAHISKEKALVNALLELCEHEALMVSWFGQRVLGNVPVPILDQQSQNFICWLKSMGWRIVLKDISLNLVPVAMAVGLGPKGKRALTIGSAAGFTLRMAAAKALTEVIRTILVDETLPVIFSSIKPEEVDDILAHGLFYVRRENLHLAQCLWDEGDIRVKNNYDIETEGMLIEDKLKLLLLKFNSLDIKVFYKDITPKLVKTKTCKLVVVKVIAPEMARLVVGYGRQPAKTKRFKDLIDRYAGGKWRNIGQIPHPFS